MKLISDASYACLIGHAVELRQKNADQERHITNLERYRGESSTEIYALHRTAVELREKNARLFARIGAAERRVQELTLLCGMKGYTVETTPDTPAVPAKPGVLVLTKISKS
jgi:hypothetical protein